MILKKFTVEMSVRVSDLKGDMKNFRICLLIVKKNLNDCKIIAKDMYDDNIKIEFKENAKLQFKKISKGISYFFTNLEVLKDDETTFLFPFFKLIFDKSSIASKTQQITIKQNNYEYLKFSEIYPLFFPSFISEKIFCDCIKECKNILKICTRTFTCNQVADFIKTLNINKIQIIFDLEYHKTKDSMEFIISQLSNTQNVEFYGYQEKTLNNSFIIIDQKILINGTLNLTSDSLKKTQENLLIFRKNQFIIDRFTDLFDQLKNSSIIYNKKKISSRQDNRVIFQRRKNLNVANKQSQQKKINMNLRQKITLQQGNLTQQIVKSPQKSLTNKLHAKRNEKQSKKIQNLTDDEGIILIRYPEQKKLSGQIILKVENEQPTNDEVYEIIHQDIQINIENSSLSDEIINGDKEDFECDQIFNLINKKIQKK